jgi:hypothetical protein
MMARIGRRRGSNYPFAHYHLAECRQRAGDPTGASEYDLKAASTHFGTRCERLARERLTSATPTQAQPGCDGSSRSAGAAPEFLHFARDDASPRHDTCSLENQIELWRARPSVAFAAIATPGLNRS